MVLPQNVPEHTLDSDIEDLIDRGLGNDTLPTQQRILRCYSKADLSTTPDGGLHFRKEMMAYMGMPDPLKMMLTTMMASKAEREDMRRHSLFVFVDWVRTQSILEQMDANMPAVGEWLDYHFRSAHDGTAADILARAHARSAARADGTATPDSMTAMEPPEFFR